MVKKILPGGPAVLLILFVFAAIPCALNGQSIAERYKASTYQVAKNYLEYLHNINGHTSNSALSSQLEQFPVPSSSYLGHFAVQQTTGSAEQSLVQALLLGLYLRPSFNNFSGDGTDDLESRTGLDFGAYMMMPLFVRLELIRELYLLAALSYLSRGAAYNYAFEDFSYKERIRLSYISVAILMRASVSLAENFPVLTSLYLAVGPKLGLLVGDRIKVTVDGDTQTSELGAQNINFALAFALGALIPYRSGFLDLSLQYEFGLAKIAESGDANWRTTALMFSLGYMFSLSQILNR